MAVISYIVGDATRPQGDGLKIVAHVVNNSGGWGAGFVMALSKKWARPEAEYRRWCRERGEDFRRMLGCVQLVPVEEDVWVANVLGQHGTGRGPDGSPPIRYEALARGFARIADFAAEHPERRVSVHSPRLGCGLAGGTWGEVEPLLERHLVRRGVPVIIYDLP